ncbi:DNA-binding protein [Cereibacter sphaeroides]|uniref:helix-turn-helix transcriptional regulator n=1 Tax=Cereibacter sphaeroides TaxID=1063 RepID=UPI000F53A9CB|nr:DNA-binding protein [Cereibacter sphaeroides]AZB68177.1 DNA-binding protein [Cereibacter sphaeroides]
MAEQLLTPEEAAALLRIGVRSLLIYRAQGLRYVRLGGRTIRYRLDDINDFLNDRTQDGCPSAPRKQRSGNTTSRSGVVAFEDLAARRTMRRQRP